MPGIFSRIKSKEGSRKKRNGGLSYADQPPSKPTWTDAWARKSVEPEEIDELLRGCTDELKSRGLDQPFLLLPFRPTSDPSAVRTFVRNFFGQGQPMSGERLKQELRMSEPMVISGVAKWCWGRLQGGVVGWDAYELFKIGEGDSRMARDSFKTFIPLSVESDSRQRIIFNFFDLLAAVAAHGKKNGLSGRKLSRMAAWWAFEPKETTQGFEGGYKAWLSAADATSHLFFAFLRSLAPDQNVTGISLLPMSLKKLLHETEYPPQRPDLMMTKTSKVAMIVDTVSPTPFSLLRRANHFEYRDTDRALQEFSSVEDPVQALSDECRRVLKSISAVNQSQISSSKHSTSLRDASWSRFEDIGFSSPLEEVEDEDSSLPQRKPEKLQNASAPGGADGNGNGLDRPTTPSWADFLSAGFVDDDSARSNLLLPPDKVLPPLDTEPRQRSSQSHRPRLESDGNLSPGELASITHFDLDETFWWVWITSLAPEETSERKSAFGRCAVVETKIRGGRWLVMEELVAGTVPQPEDGAYIAEKKGFLSWTKSLGRRKSTGKRALDRSDKNFSSYSIDKATSGHDVQAKIQAKAALLRTKETEPKLSHSQTPLYDISKYSDEKTDSGYRSNIGGEATSALNWVSKYDKGAIKDAYTTDARAGKGFPAAMTDDSAHKNGKANGMSSETFLEDEISTPPIKIKEDDTPNTSEQISSPIRSATTQVTTSQPMEPARIERTPTPPPKDEPTPVATPTTVTESATTLPTPEKSLGGQQKDKKSSGLKKLFSRKNRLSRLPHSLSSSRLSEPPPPTTDAQPSSSIAGSVPEPVEEELNVEENNEPTFDPAMGDNISQMGAGDADQVERDFSRFDHGSSVEQSGYAPEDDEHDPNDATPPPIARKPTRPKHAVDLPEEKLSNSAGPGVQDRWAQIRKNAADRAAQRQAEEQGKYSLARANTDGDEKANAEETIESRVARIKARVAEVTGNMEANSPSRPSPVRSPDIHSPEEPLSPESKTGHPEALEASS